MSDVSAVLNSIIAKGQNEKPGDYRGDDGLLYCGKCGKPKEAKMDRGALEGRKVPIPCECRQNDIQIEQGKLSKQRAEELRKYCLPRDQMRKCSFEYAEDASQIKTAQAFVEHWSEVSRDGTGLIFWGNTGTGKSFAALCIANALIDRQIPVRYFSAVDMVSDLMDKDKRESIFRIISEVPLLILDDIGAERQTEYAREQLCRVIDARIEAGKPLICTTNYSLTDMQNTTDSSQARTFDRILSICVPVKFVGESRRKAIASNRLASLKQLIEN